jgi:hypothetical protein
MAWVAPNRCRRWLLAFVVALMPGLAEAAVLIEAQAEDGPVRIVIGLQSERVLVERGGREPVLVDLAGGEVFIGRGEAAERIRLLYRPGYEEPPPFRLEQFGPGPVIAGHGSLYYVLFVEDAVCAEVLVSSWMRPFVDPAIQALSLIEQIEQPASADRADACGQIPIATLAAAGWPLLVGKLEAPELATETIRFDYLPAPDELQLPASAADVEPGAPDTSG